MSSTNNESQQPATLLTPEQLAERWSMDHRTLANWRYAGKGPKYMRLMGKRGPVRYRLSDVLEYEEGREVVRGEI